MANFKKQLIAPLALLALAAVLFHWLNPASEKQDGTSFFYDLNEQKLFAAPSSSIPPIAGLKTKELVAVRAMVISTNGNAQDLSSRRIAYLEKYGPELKKQLEAAQATGAEATPSREERRGQMFVRRLNEAEWHAYNTPEAEAIMTDWQTEGADGRTPVVCTPP